MHSTARKHRRRCRRLPPLDARPATGPIEQAVAEHRPLTLVHTIHSVTPAFIDAAIVDAPQCPVRPRRGRPQGARRGSREGRVGSPGPRGARGLRPRRTRARCSSSCPRTRPCSSSARVAAGSCAACCSARSASSWYGTPTARSSWSVPGTRARSATASWSESMPRRSRDRSSSSPTGRPSLRDLPLTVLDCVWDIAAGTMGAYLVSDAPADLEDERLALAEAMAGMTEKYPDVHVTTTMARGIPQEALVRLGERMDLIVVGAHQNSRLSQAFFGSVSVAVVENATAPVAVVPLSTVPARRRPCRTTHTKPVVVGVDETPAGQRGVRYAAMEARRLGDLALDRARHPGLHARRGSASRAGGRAPVLRARAARARPQARPGHGARPRGRDDPGRRQHHRACTGRAAPARQPCWCSAPSGARSPAASGPATSSAGVAAQSACPVVVVPPEWEPAHEHGRVVVGVKDPENAAELVAAGLELADDLGARARRHPRLEGALGIRRHLRATDLRRRVRPASRQPCWSHSCNAHRAEHHGVPVRIEVLHTQPAHALVRGLGPRGPAAHLAPTARRCPPPSRRTSDGQSCTSRAARWRCTRRARTAPP